MLNNCDAYSISVRLLRHNDALPVVISAIKTSAGLVKEKGLDYYLNEYLKRKSDKAWEWLVDASKKYPSVLEHWVFTFFIDGCSRVCTHQLVRHRIASYTQESQRYSFSTSLSLVPEEYLRVARTLYGDEEQRKLHGFIEWMKSIKRNIESLRYMSDPPKEIVDAVISPLNPFVVIPPSMPEREKLEYAYRVVESLQTYAELVLSGVSYEYARYVLPSSIRTRIVMTANLREWLHIIRLRGSKHAQEEIRCLAQAIKRELGRVIPVIDKMV